MKRVLFALLLSAAPLVAQTTEPELSFEDGFLLRMVSGTASNPGLDVPHIRTGDGPWTFFVSGSAHVTYVNEVGPEVPRDEVFSTNWITGGLHGAIGDRTLFVLRGRLSAEPFTTGDDGYPQLLQFVSGESGDFLIDRMRPQDLIGEAGAQIAFHLGGTSFLHAYGAVVGDPAFGPPPFQLRSSGVDFAEAPFGYDLHETTHDSTSVVTLGYASRFFSIEASAFHDAFTTGDHTELDTGDIDAQSARLTIMPTPNLQLQVSRAELGEELGERELTSASLTWGTQRAAVTAMWTSRQFEGVDDAQTGYGLEATFRSARNTFMIRLESVDRPIGFPLVTGVAAFEDTNHAAVGYIFDFISNPRFRGGAGVNIDYHTQSHELPHEYGHKPQAIFAFVRFRTN